MAAPSTWGPKSLKEYLKRYESNGEEELQKKKRKKKVESKPDARGVLVVDEDPVWQKPVNLEEENDDSAGASLPPDLSPLRKSRKDAAVKEQPKTGLVSGQDISEEIARTKKNDLLRFNKMDPSISGRGAEPVYRDRIKGERISKEEFLKPRQKVKVEEKPKEVKLEWGKGLAQKREAEVRLQELELEKDKPFARTRDDPELDNMMKERLRWGDPMAHLVKKKHPELNLPNLGDSEKMKESGFIIPQDIPNHSWLKRGLDAAPNRYGIRPGRHWDGVDRSNGFEKGSFKMTEKRIFENASKHIVRSGAFSNGAENKTDSSRGFGYEEVSKRKKKYFSYDLGFHIVPFVYNNHLSPLCHAWT